MGAANNTSTGDAPTPLTAPVDDPEIIYRLLCGVEEIDYSEEECWEWNGSISNGYGYIHANGNPQPVHRLMVRVRADHQISPEWDVHHTCGNKLCIAPSHLSLVDRSEHRIEHQRDSLRQRDKDDDDGLSIQDIRDIRRRYEHTGINQYELADEYGIDQTFVSSIVRGKAYWYID